MVAIPLSHKAKSAKWQETLRQWLEWNEAYELLTARLFHAKDDPSQLEALADELDRCRQAIAAASRELLDQTAGG